ncbi:MULTISPECIES: HNH endonuclease [unclassified Polaribacter]|jgi:predicted restriction endonuclease|uniref:HNH endonuclease n=1 Tax=unclassified Polaribacter TaxID=196858 RepID=UPI0011BD49A9|nr:MULTISPECIES: HNH endonuclease [unclassified Polaribacter]TXD53227.1 HNH endonuclease [Polaribacter sp. IC063]TXD61374.1 HNH endonuclease [Polaribacter sp. IC066]
MDYINSEPEFYKFLTFDEKISKKVRTNYISWLRFLSQNHKIDDKLNFDKIDAIISIEEKRKINRNFYTKDKDLSNFKSSLRKYNKYLNNGFSTKIKNSIRKEEDDINVDNKITNTEKESLILSRIGQGNFRNNLIKYWSTCSVTNFDKTGLLIASHIKPWKESNNIERLDAFNGLLLLPNYDKLFDRGYINFDSNGKIKISKFLNAVDKNILNINSEIKLRNLEKEHIKYLEYHKEFCFIN